MSVIAIACYRPKPGKENDLHGLMKIHLPMLRAERLVDDGPSLCGCARDGAVVEMFTWKSQEAIDAAHKNPAVLAMWDKYAKCCDYAPVADLAEAKDLFCQLTPLDLT